MRGRYPRAQLSNHPWACELGEAGLANRLPVSIPTAQPTPSSVTARNGSRLSFEAAPRAVCLAVVFAALPASFLLIGVMRNLLPALTRRNHLPKRF
jgi:hypothetical protein